MARCTCVEARVDRIHLNLSIKFYIGFQDMNSLFLRNDKINSKILDLKPKLFLGTKEEFVHLILLLISEFVT